jgi:serpin B
MFKLLAITLAVVIGLSSERPVRSTQLSSANTKFNLDLLQHLYDDKKNVFYSPFSISAALGMLYAGARGNTAQEMRQVLGYKSADLSDQQIYQQFSEILSDIKSTDSKKYQLSVANKLVVQKNFDILESYKSDVQKYFKSSVESVNFADSSVVSHINQWVSSQTHDKIKKILDEPLGTSTRLVILNAVYFKGLFQTQFSKDKTREETFFNGGNTQKSTQMMKRTGQFNYTEVPEINSQLLEIPYTGDDVSLYVVLPNQRDGLKTLNNQLSAYWSQVESSIGKLRKQVVEVTIPKFKVETSYSLGSVLSRMGMKSVFTPSADLSGIDGKKDLDVSEVLHKAYVEVNEEGTEAAAATAIIVKETASVDAPVRRNPVFRADHPFMFFIRNNRNGMVLFSGHINQL